jgi:hypothetical protein
MRRTAKVAEIVGEEQRIGSDSDFMNEIKGFSDLVEL